MQPAQPTPPTPPSPPSPVAPDAGDAPVIAADARAVGSTAPQTAQELAALRGQRDETVDQLVATHSRRRELQDEMRQTPQDAQEALRAQMVELDRRVLQMEKDVSALDHLIATAPASLGAEAGVLTAVQAVAPRGFVLLGPNGPSANAVPALLLLITLLQVALLIRSRVRRAPAFQADAVARESAARLARVEQAVDAIAVEVERVSEGQRFVTRLLAESRPAEALPGVRAGADEATRDPARR